MYLGDDYDLFYILKFAHYFFSWKNFSLLPIITSASQEYESCIICKDFCVVLLLWMRALHVLCVVCVCMLSVKVRSGHWIPWTWSYKWLWATIWVLGTEPSSSAGAASASICWTISLALSCTIFDMSIQCYVSFREGWIYKSILFIHLYVALYLRGLEKWLWGFSFCFVFCFSWKPLLPDRKVLHQGTILAYLHFHFSRGSVRKNRSHIQISHDALERLGDWVFFLLGVSKA